jgi:hypothetical protein
VYKHKFPFVFISFVIIFFSSTNLFSQEGRNMAFGINVFNAYTFWQNPYFQEEYDNLGIGTFINPTFKMKSNNLNFTFDFTFSHFNFVGPDVLTRTGPDNDVDTGFESNMRRSDFGLQIDHNLYKIINISIASKYVYMHIQGDNNQKFESQSTYNYIDKGIMIGPGIILNFPNNTSKLHTTLSVLYLFGTLSNTYDDHGLAKNNAIKRKYDTQLLSAELGLNVHLKTNLMLYVSLKSDLYHKKKQESYYKCNSDLFLVGVNIGIFYLY